MRTLSRLTLFLALLTLTGCMAYSTRYKAESRVEQTLPHVNASGLKLETKNGSITVRVDESAGSTVTIVADIRAAGATQEEADRRLADTKLHIDRLDDRTLHVRAVWPEPRNGNDACSLEITVPGASGIYARSGNGAISITGAAGFADLHTSNGAVTVRDHGGDARIETSNGKITCANVAGRCDVGTSNGKLELADVRGGVTGSTSNGAVILELRNGSSGDFDITTSNGAIRASVASDWAGSIDASTSNGSIDVSGDNLSLKKHSKHHLTIRCGAGGHTGTLRTSNGSITVEVHE